MGNWGDFCPNCGSKEIEKISENEIYCVECDESFKRDKGKVTHKKGSLVEQIKNKAAEQDARIEKIEKVIDPDDNLFGF
ncbi:hypothetical protein ES702_05972 [subsurface metagenome]